MTSVVEISARKSKLCLPIFSRERKEEREREVCDDLKMVD